MKRGRCQWSGGCGRPAVWSNGTRRFCEAHRATGGGPRSREAIDKYEDARALIDLGLARPEIGRLQARRLVDQAKAARAKAVASQWLPGQTDSHVGQLPEAQADQIVAIAADGGPLFLVSRGQDLDLDSFIDLDAPAERPTGPAPGTTLLFPTEEDLLRDYLRCNKHRTNPPLTRKAYEDFTHVAHQTVTDTLKRLNLSWGLVQQHAVAFVRDERGRRMSGNN